MKESIHSEQARADAAFERLLADLQNYQETTTAEMIAEKAVEDACKAYAKRKAAKRKTGQR